MPFAYIQYLDRNGRPTRPTDPGYGVDEGGNPDQGFDPNYPDQGLPGGGRPGHLPSRPGRPVDPGWGISDGRPGHLPGRPGGPGRPVDPGWGVEEGRPGHLPSRPGPRPPHPDQGLPGFGSGLHPDHRPPWHKPERPPHVWPPGPTDPDWGIDAPIDTPDHPAHLPGAPEGGIEGEAPDNTLPPVDGHQPPPDAPPGTIWPPLPPDAPTGKHAFLVWISGVGLRYGVFQIPEHETDPGYGVGEGGAPDQGLPGGGGRPPTAGQPLPRPPGGARPPTAGQPLPRPPIGSAGTPTQPIAPSPPTPQPKR
jgi:hypothetical protein